MINTVIMPKQGLQMTEGVIIEWLFKEGEAVKIGEPLFRMETDKLEITIDSQFDGILLKILAGEGETVPITAPIAYIGEAGDTVPDTPPTDKVEAAPEKPVEAPIKAVEPPAKATFPPQKKRGKIFITPRAKKRAAELDIDYNEIDGSGYNGIIIERDILDYKPPVKAEARLFAFHAVDIDFTDAAAYALRLNAAEIAVTDEVLIGYAIYRALSGSDSTLALAAFDKEVLSELNATFKAVSGVAMSVFSPSDGIDYSFTAGEASDRACVYKDQIAVRKVMTLTVSFAEENSETAANALNKTKKLLEAPILLTI